MVTLPWQKVQRVSHPVNPAAAWHVAQEGPEPPVRLAPWQLLQAARPVRFTSYPCTVPAA